MTAKQLLTAYLTGAGLPEPARVQAMTLVEAVVAEEREACAQLVERQHNGFINTGKATAEAIRARGK